MLMVGWLAGWLAGTVVAAASASRELGKSDVGTKWDGTSRSWMEDHA